MKTIAVIGPTASGKSDLAITAAKATKARILSLDSLSIYKEIDIASAKPTLEERGEIVHYGIDLLSPDEYFSAATFVTLFREAEQACREAGVPLIIVGGSSFYLKALTEGMSQRPELSPGIAAEVRERMQERDDAYRFMAQLDPAAMHKIAPGDSYRLSNMLGLYLQTGVIPSAWFEAHPPAPVLTEYTLFEIDAERETLRKRIALRTQKMIRSGLIDEVAALEQKYGRAPNAMKAIGIVEVLEYLDGKTTETAMTEAIVTHTAQLAKRQQTFNRNQFAQKTVLPLESLSCAVLQSLTQLSE